jgi:low affinity Fe/Cu permease
MHQIFNRVSRAVSDATGHPIAFCIAACVILVWAVSGPIFDFSDTWQLVINTGTTIVTFLLVFIIQATQNRDSKALHVKLDALIGATPDADDRLKHLEQANDKQLKEAEESV